MVAFFDQQPNLSDSIRFRRLGLVVDETVKMIREATYAVSNPGTDWTAKRFLSHVDFEKGCGGVIRSPEEELSLYEQLVGSRRDLDCFIKKEYRPSKATLQVANVNMDFYRRDSCISDGYTSDTEPLECLVDFVENRSQKNYTTACSMTRISLFLHLMRMRLRAPKDVNQDVFLNTMLPSHILAPVPCKYSDLAGYLHSGTPQDFSFLTLVVLARRTYKDMFMSANFPVDSVLKNAKALWTRNWTIVAPTMRTNGRDSRSRWTSPSSSCTVLQREVDACGSESFDVCKGQSGLDTCRPTSPTLGERIRCTESFRHW